MSSRHRSFLEIRASNSFYWIGLCILLFISNSAIHPDDYLTKISALDSVIYLAIADAAPDLPMSGSNLVYHGSMRFLFPYVLGVLGKFFEVSSWVMFRLAAHGLVLLTVGFFWSITRKLNAHVSIRFLATSVLCFHVYLFRLQLAFSGFINDGLFVLGLTLAIWAIFSESYLVLVIAIMAMAIGKQTLFFVLPVFVCWTFLKRANKTSLLNLFVFWSITIAGVLSYYLTVHQIISSFSSPGSTKNMATGMLTWLFSTPLNIGIRQLAEFLSLGFFGLLAPLSLVAAIYLRSPKFVSTHQGLLIVLTVMAMLQPYLSGPIITDRSIMRLESLALVPLLLIGVAKAGENSLSIAPKTLIALISILFLSSFHHLFSVLGPNLELRKVFACTQTALLLFFFYIFYRALGLSTNEPSTPPSSHDA